MHHEIATICSKYLCMPGCLFVLTGQCAASLPTTELPGHAQRFPRSHTLKFARHPGPHANVRHGLMRIAYCGVLPVRAYASCDTPHSILTYIRWPSQLISDLVCLWCDETYPHLPQAFRSWRLPRGGLPFSILLVKLEKLGRTSVRLNILFLLTFN